MCKSSTSGLRSLTRGKEKERKIDRKKERTGGEEEEEVKKQKKKETNEG
jgi:hypothetical protein